MAETGSADCGAPGVRLRRRPAAEIASLVARRGSADALAAKIREVFGIGLPSGRRRACAGDLTALGVGPARWLLLREGGGCEFDVGLARAVAGLGAVTAQSDGYVVARISGPCARQSLAKGVSIDLHPRAFGAADVAVTQAAHMGLILWQMDDEPTYDLAVFRSYERDMWAWLRESSAEFRLSDETAP